MVHQRGGRHKGSCSQLRVMLWNPILCTQNRKKNDGMLYHGQATCHLGLHGLQQARLPCPSPTPRAHSNSCPSCWWCYPIISSSVSPSPPALNLSHHQSLFHWVSSSYQVAKVLVSASASVLPVNIQDWFPLGWTGWISLQSKGLSRVFSNTTVQKHQFFSTQLSL